ncbi:nucleotidyl transferase AbiEii/AbiGii toxin family protein [Sphingobacterium detergens]|uniref:Nucleotidyltransferase AbiEii toxin of type IV toxin-antitoxin system n=1 Tax=Sphingobacterium detergens TaxID=1145106 RepID=A0A420B811_SPHD1|nr:nucleotidyl transferase AbiEii/AbiGii toxin family protein [Sphingobacterium detergens]RKE52778.1 nucleotidyltransferase AbiEii toxin of type IV toxin-antitoxin system [Sphingobacterium detergens]
MWLNLKTEQKKLVLDQLSNIMGLPAFVIEKDWWVCIVLKAVFATKYAESIIFKGGTSLSKAYQLIDRFSEDIDLIIDRHLLGFDELDSKSQIKKLRKASGGFIVNEFREELIIQLEKLGVSKELYEIRYNAHVDDTSDPNTLEIYYQPVTPIGNVYIQQRVLLEMGARSLTEPFETQGVVSFIDNHYKDQDFIQPPFNVRVVIPTRTFIEKILLLHEEFSKPVDKIRTDRLTRHFYDIDRIMNTDFGAKAIADDELFNTIVQHRKTVTPLRGADYSNHQKGRLRIFPPVEVIKEWEADYKTMRENMIVGESLTWEDLLTSVKRIEDSMNNHKK